MGREQAGGQGCWVHAPGETRGFWDVDSLVTGNAHGKTSETALSLLLRRNSEGLRRTSFCSIYLANPEMALPLGCLRRGGGETLVDGFLSQVCTGIFHG